MEDCIFCKFYVKAGSTPSNVVYEDETVIAFLDIKPISTGHTIVIPKQHTASFEDLPVESAKHLTEVLQNLAPQVVSGVEADGYNLGLNSNEVAGQVIPHVHWHIIPRIKADSLNGWDNKDIEFSEIEKVASNIKLKIK